MNNVFNKCINYSNNEISLEQKKIPPWLRKLPNRLTYLRILCIPVVVYLMTYGDLADETWRFWDVKPISPSSTDIIAAIVFSVAAITDLFDGLIARKFQIETMLGKLLDPLADKLLVVS
ncbi:MAG: CDP-alcohol phosphatidyltransferase family protein, partial [Bdellovibrionota bacterium]